MNANWACQISCLLVSLVLLIVKGVELRVELTLAARGGSLLAGKARSCDYNLVFIFNY